MLKVYRNISSPIICEIFNWREIDHELRNFAKFSVAYVKVYIIEQKAYQTWVQISGRLFQMESKN